MNHTIRRNRVAVGLVVLSGLIAVAAARSRPRIPSDTIAGVVEQGSGTVAGVLVTARREGVRVSVLTDERGRFSIGDLGPGEYQLSISGAGYSTPGVVAQPGSGPVRLTAGARPIGLAEHTGSHLLSMLPESQEKRRFILDCTGCHVFDARVAYPEGKPRTRESWQERTVVMHQMFGPQSPFPIISARQTPEQVAGYLSEHIRGVVPAVAHTATARPGTFQITEYDFPDPRDLPHDVAVDRDGQVVVTGMFTHVMQVLDPATGRFREVSIPVQGANPRAVEIDSTGAWWVILGMPRKVARFDPAASQWRTWDVGVYAHSIALTADGFAWYNGHFTRTPGIIGRVRTAADSAEPFEIPPHPEAHVGAGPIPYEIRAAPNGKVWGSELIGNRIFEFDPQRQTFRVWDMPTRDSGPRRLDVGPDGIVWIPEYSGNRLARLDPATGRITEFEFPESSVLPYVTRVDPRTGIVWTGTGAADALFSFDPRTQRFTKYPLPVRGALVRHLAIGADGSVWAAYGASPGIPNRIARLRVRDAA